MKLVKILFKNLFFFALVISFISSTVNAQSDKQPNILFILTDDLRTDAISAYNMKPWAKSSNIDQLAKEGVLFKRAYANSPSCAPSRESILSGKYPHHSGVYGFDITHNSAPNQDPYFTRLLHKAGYRMRSFGKVGNLKKEKSSKEKWEQCPAYPDGEKRFKTYKKNGYRWNPRSVPKDCVGKEEGDKEYNIIRRPERKTGEGIIHGGMNPCPAGNTIDDLVTKDAIEWMEENSFQKESPFFLNVGYNVAHTPVLVPRSFYNREVDPHEVQWPFFTEREKKRMPKQVLNMSDEFSLVSLSHEQRLQLTADYYNYAYYGDILIGRLIDAFKQYSADRPWLIVFTSDQGWHLGEHNMSVKFTFYQESVQVPLIIASSDDYFPKDMAYDELVELVDLAPTFLKAGNVKLPTWLDGKDLKGQLNGKFKPRKYVISEQFHVMKRAMIRSKDWMLSLQQRPDVFDMGENYDWVTTANKKQFNINLFHTKTDPEEINNLADHPAYQDKLEELKSVLIDRIFTDRFEYPWYEDISKQRQIYNK